MPAEFIVPSLQVATITNMVETNTMQRRLDQLMEINEDRFIISFHQRVQKVQRKVWHDKHIGNKYFHQGMLVFLYCSKFLKHLGKF